MDLMSIVSSVARGGIIPAALHPIIITMLEQRYMNALAAIKLIMTAIGTATEAYAVIQRTYAVLTQAANEKRDITPSELAAIQADNQALTERVSAKLRNAANG